MHWVRLDATGAPRDTGTWRFDGLYGSKIELLVRGATATVTCYRGTHQLHTFDLRDPTGPARVVSIPRGAKLLDARAGRMLLSDAGDIVCCDAGGVELVRSRSTRPLMRGILSNDGTGVAIVYLDCGVEVFRT